jgi:hypothetical protein
MTRTASHNSALSLGSCISAAVTVLSIRTVAPLSNWSGLAPANTARLTAPQTWGSAQNYVRSRPLLDTRHKGSRFSLFPFVAGMLGYLNA